MNVSFFKASDIAFCSSIAQSTPTFETMCLPWAYQCRCGYEMIVLPQRFDFCPKATVIIFATLPCNAVPRDVYGTIPPEQIERRVESVSCETCKQRANPRITPRRGGGSGRA